MLSAKNQGKVLKLNAMKVRDYEIVIRNGRHEQKFNKVISK